MAIGLPVETLIAIFKEVDDVQDPPPDGQSRFVRDYYAFSIFLPFRDHH